MTSMVPDATPVGGFSCLDLTTFCRLDELGLEVTDQHLEPHRALLGAGSSSRTSGAAAVAARGFRITAVQQVRAAPYTVLGWVLDDLEDEIDRLTAAGVDFNRYDGISQDQRGIWTAHDGTRVAWFHDPDGNNLSLQP